MTVPTKVKISAYLMFAVAVLDVCAGFGIMAYVMMIPSMMEGTADGMSQAELDAMITSIQIGAGFGACITFLIAGLYAFTGYGLLNLKGWARIVTIILSIIALCNFPIGTIIGGFILYVMFSDEESVQAFNKA